MKMLRSSLSHSKKYQYSSVFLFLMPHKDVSKWNIGLHQQLTYISKRCSERDSKKILFEFSALKQNWCAVSSTISCGIVSIFRWERLCEEIFSETFRCASSNFEKGYQTGFETLSFGRQSLLLVEEIIPAQNILFCSKHIYMYMLIFRKSIQLLISHKIRWILFFWAWAITLQEIRGICLMKWPSNFFKIYQILEDKNCWFIFCHILYFPY